MRWIIKSIFIFIFLSSCNTEVFQLELYCGTVISDCSGSYNSASVEMIPLKIYSAAKTEIKKLISEENYQKSIEFVEFQFIDSCEIAINYEWVVPQYRINFKWKQPENSLISNYCFNITLDSNGNLLNPVQLGNSINDSLNLTAISMDSFKVIWERAVKHEIDGYYLGYDTTLQLITIEMVKYLDFGDSDVISSEISERRNIYTGEILE